MESAIPNLTAKHFFKRKSYYLDVHLLPLAPPANFWTMVRISPDTIQNALNKLDSFNEMKAQQYMQQFADRQPHLLAYLMANAETLPYEEEVEKMLYFAAVVWECFIVQTNGNIPLVTEKKIVSTEKKRKAKMEKLLKADEAEFMNEATNMAQNLAQPHLEEFLYLELAPKIQEEDFEEEDDENPTKVFNLNHEEVKEPNEETIFLSLQLMVESLHDAVNGPKLKIVHSKV